jgi:SAM-dependent methyltransferase
LSYQLKELVYGMDIPAENLKRTGTLSMSDFKKVGEALTNRIHQLLEDLHIPLKNIRLLDFGCGVGRITSPLACKIDNESFIFACDVDKENLTHIVPSYKVIPLVTTATPPLPFLDNYFDVVISVSVFTHFNEELQRSWLNELNRILSPKGCALLTVAGINTYNIHKGKRYGHTSTFTEKDLIEKGLIFFKTEAGGSIHPGSQDYGLTFHSSTYVKEQWSHFIRVEDVILGGCLGGQDIVVCRKLLS